MGEDNKENTADSQETLNDALASLDALLDDPSHQTDDVTPAGPEPAATTAPETAASSGDEPPAEEQLELPVLSELVTDADLAGNNAAAPPADSGTISSEDREAIRQQAMNEVKEQFDSFSAQVVHQCLDNVFTEYMQNTRKELEESIVQHLRDNLQQLLDDLADEAKADDN
jgi:hypothetical protein